MSASGEWRVPGYTEVSELGAGGGGRVVLAVHDESGSTVAIKYLPSDLRRDPRFADMFGREARVLAEVNDPNIARLYEFVQNDRGAAIVMEAVRGVSLRALLREHGGTGPEAALVVLKGSLLGLATAHALGVVHRDYKPENVLVQADGASKLVDFGIAVRRGDAAPVAGTPPYMSPEQWRGLAASPATDVYAATAVFFECLTGHRPYQATVHTVLMRQHQSAPIPVEQVPEPVRGLVARGLAKEALARPDSAAAFVAELEQVALAAYGEDWEERGRHRLAALAGLLTALLPLGPAVPDTGTTLFRTLLRAARRNGPRLVTGLSVAVVAAGAAAYVLVNANPASTTFDIVSASPPASSAPAVPTPQDDPQAPPASPSPEASSTVSPTDPLGGSVPDAPDPSPEPSGIEVPGTPPASAPPTSPPPATAPPTTAPPTTAPPTPEVSSLRLAGLAVDGTTAAGTVHVSTTGTGTVTLTVRMTVANRVVHTRRITLDGATSYTRAFRHDLKVRPCGQTVGMTAESSPAAAGGTASAQYAVPACPTEVTGLRLSLDVADPPASGVRAAVDVDTSGPGDVALTADFRAGGDTVASRALELGGQRSYARVFTHTFRERMCGSIVSVTVRAKSESNSATETAQARVTCPASVTGVRITRAAVPRNLGTASVAVTTGGTQAVTLRVAFKVNGQTLATAARTLSGDTSYNTTVRAALPSLKCGTTWTAVASTVPAAEGGGDSYTGTTPECPRDIPSPPAPAEPPTPSQGRSPAPDGPGTDSPR
ncbi:serine/threonine-protein kinase [Sinosporangium siamense]|uniref:non-specific serine/threonine protein kinase n=1 Tax=Sinosporangium siamense TaxID=1367973 RepID=A0A919RHJ6_9ACTN|nr:serine/threonine-protein kinase [Sinosporangium siamense]GII92930.1 hypothetical protein Ssi02_31610 [Sinosporangium siamense]